MNPRRASILAGDVPVPAGLCYRPLTLEDATTVHRLLVADEEAAIGRADVDLADVIAGWQRPSFVIEQSTIGLFDAGELVGFAAHLGDECGEIVWHPTRSDPSLGQWLAHWLVGLMRGRGQDLVSVGVPLDGPGDRALTGLGFEERWRAWTLELGAGNASADLPARQLPPGCRVRTADPSEYPAVHDLIETAFLEWAERPRRPYPDFEATVLRRNGFQPWMIRAVVSADGDLLAATHLTLTEDAKVHVACLATRADQRNRGLAQALLLDSLVSGRQHGATTLTLATDSRTGALDLYLKLNMVITSTWIERAARV